MNKINIISIIVSLISIAFFVMAIISFSGEGNMGPAYLCIGSALLCTTTVLSRRARKKDEETKNKDEK